MVHTEIRGFQFFDYAHFQSMIIIRLIFIVSKFRFIYYYLRSNLCFWCLVWFGTFCSSIYILYGLGLLSFVDYFVFLEVLCLSSYSTVPLLMLLFGITVCLLHIFSCCIFLCKCSASIFHVFFLILRLYLRILTSSLRLVAASKSLSNLFSFGYCMYILLFHSLGRTQLQNKRVGLKYISRVSIYELLMSANPNKEPALYFDVHHLRMISLRSFLVLNSFALFNIYSKWFCSIYNKWILTFFICSAQKCLRHLLSR